MRAAGMDTSEKDEILITTAEKQNGNERQVWRTSCFTIIRNPVPFRDLLNVFTKC